MSLSQIGFFILPKEASGSNFSIVDEIVFDDAPFWNEYKVNSNYFEEIRNLLPKGKSWSNNIILYGSEDANRFEIFLRNDIVESVSFRIDFTSFYESILDKIIEFCIFKNLIILDNELNIIPLNYESIKSIIDNAPQVKKYRELSRLNR